MEKFEDKVDVKRYDYLINARNFHYNNFNLWMVFFAVIIGGILAGYCALLEKNNLKFEQIILLTAGYFTSFIWHLSCKGYYYWIINFIKLIFKCEEKLEDAEKVYSCFANKKNNNCYFNITKGANISTAVMICILSYFTAIFWAVMFFYKLLPVIIPEICTESEKINIPCVFISLVSAIVITAIFMLMVRYCKRFHSDISYHADLKL